MARRTLVVHASHLLARGYLVVSTGRATESGEPTNALFALTQAILRALAFKEPDVAVAVLELGDDGPAPPALLAPQIVRLPSVLRALGLHVVSATGAADVVASFARATVEEGGDVVIVGSDKRFAQLVTPRVWWYDAYKDVRYTPELVEKRFEVPPGEVAGWLALVGDDDTLPGVPGIGKKGATDLVREHGSVAAALDAADAVAGRTGKMLRASLDLARTELRRATLVTDRPLPAPVDALGFLAPSDAETNALYRELGFDELLRMDGGAPSDDTVVCATDAAVESAIARLAAVAEAPVAIHALTEDPSPPRGDLAGLALSGGEATTFYVPLSEAPVPEALGRWLRDPARPKVGHDVKGAAVALARRGVELAGVVGDTACASHLTEPSNWAHHDLPLVARHRLKRALQEEDAVRGAGGSQRRWSAVPIPRAAAFAGQRARAALDLWASFAPDVRGPLLDEYLALSETLVRMELRGIACDAEDLARAGADFSAMAAELEREIFALAGRSFNLGSPKQLGSVLFEDLGLPVMKRTKTGWSTATEALERIELAHPIVARVIRWRELSRLEDSWVTALSKAIDPDGRVRSTFHPARSFSGRLVNSHPDLGRVPGRTPEMARVRRAFRAPPGAAILSADYGQLGLCVLAHLTEDPALVEPLRAGEDLHRLTAAAVLDLPLEAVGPDERQRGKVVNFATFAGQGASALALQLGLSAQEAKQLIERFDRRYAVARAFQDEQLRLAQTRGYVITLAGRRWPIGALDAIDPLLRSAAERMARRATHEGSVADVSRRGLLRADQALRAAGLRAIPLHQIHDEVLFEVPLDELPAAAALVVDAMRGAFPLRVPLRVGCKAGPSWGELSPLPAAGL